MTPPPIRWAAASAAVLCVLASLVAGCDPQPPESDGPPMPKAVEFVGKVDESLVGLWKTADGRSTLNMAKNGDLALQTINTTPGGDVKTDLKGSWLVDGDRLLLKYVNKDQSESVIAYSLTHAGNSMTLSTKSPKRETKYTRK